ncbi:MAG: CcmD family protein [Saprospiraceae bacterium]|nr:CcmD family protein [Saprospiraceae bacterium]
MKKILSLTVINLCLSIALQAQDNSVDFLRSTGKIYSVVLVIAIIFLGITIFLYRLDRKLTKLENQIKNEQ